MEKKKKIKIHTYVVDFSYHNKAFNTKKKVSLVFVA